MVVFVSESAVADDGIPEMPLSSRSTTEVVLVTERMKIAVASVSLMGIGCSAGFYLATAGFFEHQFKSNTFFLKMIMSLFAPYPVVLLLQEHFDKIFDSMFGPRQTFFFRIIAVQIFLVAIFAGFSLCSNSPSGVLLCGVLLGCFTSAALSSTMQLMSAWDPTLTAWASLGKDGGGVTPVLTYFLLNFSASKASSSDFQSMQFFPIIVICVSAVCCTGLHSSGIWDKVYQRLGYDLFEQQSGQLVRQHSETDPLLPKDDLDEDGQPFWTPRWQFANGFNTFLSFILLPVVTFMRDPNLTQKLTLSKLAMDWLSRGTAALFSKTALIGIESPCHYMLVAQVTFRTVLWSMLFAHLLRYTTMTSTMFMIFWNVFYFVGSFAASQIDVTLVRFAPVRLRKKISRRNNLSNYAGLGTGLAIDVVLFFTAFPVTSAFSHVVHHSV